jgi:Flp pilus assembly protein TadG
MLIIFGIEEFGRAIWTQASLQYAVEVAARCAAVNTANCGNAAQITAYAASHSYGMSVAQSTFTFISAACGQQVSANLSFSFLVTILPYTLNLTAISCHPT